MTFSRFMQLFPDHDSCLDYLRDRFYPGGTECPKCHKATKFHRIKGRSAYGCQYCGHHVFPTAGTVFHKSSTSLQLWFWAIYLLSSTRCGISAKQLEREIGVSYPTAHRMFKQIRSLLSDEDADPLNGEVEADESRFGGKPRARQTREWSAMSRTQSQQARNEWSRRKPTVFAMVERKGRVRAFVVPDRSKVTLHGKIHEHVLPESMIFTDEWALYRGLGQRYRGHKRINHSTRVYVEGNVHTNTVEGFFGFVKNGIRGVYHSVSATYLQSYLDEYSFRYNRREGREPIFWAILGRVRKTELGAA